MKIAITVSVVLLFASLIAYSDVTANMTITRSYCNTSGNGWNCSGLELLTITFKDGTVLGPYVTVPATSEIVSAPGWSPLKTLTCP